jgi:phospholipid/cholesterol/gamma-HCH transport system ATP-binding protein
MSSAAQEVVRFEHVTVRFPGQARPLLDDIDLSIHSGETWGLIGPGAVGKTVLIKLICGLEQPTSGRVVVLGHDISRASEDDLIQVRAHIGMLFQNYALFDFMTVADNVAFPLLQEGKLARSEIDERVRSRLRAVGLAGSEGKMPSQLSGGMKKRVGLARAVIAQPSLCIYDEPTAGLDPVTTSKVYDLLEKERQETGATCLVVSSDVEALRRFCPRVAMLYEGKLRYDGDGKTMLDAKDAIVRQFVSGSLEGPL